MWRKGEIKLLPVPENNKNYMAVGTKLVLFLLSDQQLQCKQDTASYSCIFVYAIGFENVMYCNHLSLL